MDNSDDCLDTGNRLKDLIKVTSDRIKEHHDHLVGIADSMKCLKRLDSTKFEIKNLRAVRTLNNMKDYSCIKFSWEIDWESLNMCNFEREHKSFTNVNRCFNGNFVKNITEYSIDKGFISKEMNKLERKTTAGSGKYENYLYFVILHTISMFIFLVSWCH